MIDLHCHLLPGIDDGAQNIEQAVELARASADDGITHCVCTPHVHLGRFDNTKASIDAALSALRNALAEHEIDLNISAAAEVRMDIEILPMIANGEIPYLGQWKGDPVLLLEFPHGELPVAAPAFTKRLLASGIRPMIAHPERNKGIIRQRNALKPLIQQGCLLQITAASIIGNFGTDAMHVARELLKEDVVTIVATDTHHITRRPPKLWDAHEAIRTTFGDELAGRLIFDNPWEIARSHFREEP